MDEEILRRTLAASFTFSRLLKNQLRSRNLVA